MRIKKISKTETAHTWDIDVSDEHTYVTGNDHCKLICHNSSASQNVTNGIEPVRSLKSFKSSKKSSIPFLVPNIKTYGPHYQLAFDMPDNIGYLNVCNAFQRWMDMSMSCNQYFNPANYEDKKIPYAQILKEMIHFFKHGGKSLYYLNTEDGNKHFAKENVSCSSGACTL